jgi:lipopolysaccharide transport system ATP-binding protein
MAYAVDVHRVSKVYRLGGIGTHTLAEDLHRWWARFRAIGHSDTRFQGNTRQGSGQHWALDDISFVVREGEVLGIVGRNGAGKSTLLKILSQVTAPTSGRVIMRGRVASLLEVGTGFHPDLTGRENVFLNSAILGMTNAEIRKNFDAIVAFSECENFIDTPVKRYSSGMYVRLAFAVAAHLDPEILIVDEVLAVGDAQFQRKCLGKMRDVSKSGRTVLFVSHSMSAVAALCTRAVFLKAGRLHAEGNTQGIIAAYQEDMLTAQTGPTPQSLDRLPRTGSGKARFRALRIGALDVNGRGAKAISVGSDLVIETEIECLTDFAPANVAIIIHDPTGYRLIDVNTALRGEFLELHTGEGAIVKFLIRDLRLKPGSYVVSLYLGRSNIEEIDHIVAARTLEVVHDAKAQHSEQFPGVYCCEFTHSIERSPSLTPFLADEVRVE